MKTEKQGESAAVFNPWNATFEEAMAANEASTLSVGDPARPLYQWHGAQRVEASRLGAQINGFEVLACLRVCANHDLVMPEWLAFAFIRRYDAVLNCRAGSWDDPLAFGKPYPGKQLASVRKKRRTRLAVWNLVNERLSETPRPPIDKGLFEEVGKVVGLGATEAEERYREAKRFFTSISTPAKNEDFAGIKKDN